MREKEPQIITHSLLSALGGIKELVATGVELVNDGAYLWGVSDREKGKGILNHVLLTSRVAYHLGLLLKEQIGSGFENIDMICLVQGALLHDVTKLYGEDREKLPPETKSILGIDNNFREISDEVDGVGSGWLRQLGFSPEVSAAIYGHDFPETVIDNPYWKIILVADYMTGQTVTTISERLTDVKTRWIHQPLLAGSTPRISPDRFEVAERNIRQVATEIFQILGTTDKEFIVKHELNNERSQTRWEKFLLNTRNQGKEERAKRLVDNLVS